MTISKSIRSSLAVILTVCMLFLSATGIRTSAKTTFKSYKAVIKYHKENPPADSSTYSYLNLKTKKGTVKAMTIVNLTGMYMTNSELYIPVGGKIKLVNKFPGYITHIAKDKKSFMTYGYSGMGMGGYRFFKYNAKKDKFEQKYAIGYDTESYQYPERETAAKNKLLKKCKIKMSDYKQFNTPSTKI